MTISYPRQKKAMKRVLACVGTKAELARRLGCTRSYAGRIVEGKQRVSADMCRDIEAITQGKVTPEMIRPDIFKKQFQRYREEMAVRKDMSKAEPYAHRA